MDKSVCFGCEALIEDRYLLRVIDQCWHEGCMYCSVCMQPLRKSCFIKDKQLYCKLDYDRLYGVRCAKCLQLIPSHEFVMRAVNQVYHVTCFVCAVCGRQLNKGDQFIITDSSHIYCSVHFDMQSQCSSYLQLSPESQLNGDWFSAAGHNYRSDDDSSLDDCDGDQPKGPKRPRTILTTSQRRKFKASFEVNSKPCRKVRETLAAETGLSVRVVQVWFQNQRAKMKKLARRQTEDCQHLDGANKDKKNSLSSMKHIKKLKEEISQSSLVQSGDFSCDQPSANCAENSSQSLNNGTHEKHESYNSTSKLNDPFFRDLLTENMATAMNHQGIDMTTHTIESLTMMINGGGITTERTVVAPSTGVGNPIDKLYSMQTSYFSTS